MNNQAAVHPSVPFQCRLLVSLLVVAGLEFLAPRGRTDGLLHLNIAGTNSNVVVTWTNPSVALESALVLTGAWTEVTGAVSPQIILPTNPASFFRLRAGPLPPDFSFRYLAPTFTASIGEPVGCGCTSPENPNTPGSGSVQDNGMGNVFLHTGEVVQRAVDLEIPGRGFNWQFERFYRSGMNYDGPMGQGWDFSQNRRLVVETNGNVLRVDGLGRVDRYVLSGGAFQAPSGFYTRLTRNLDGTFTERDRHGATNSYSTTNGLGIARLTRIGDRNGNQMTFQYNPGGQLSNVVDTLGRSIAYAYDANGRLTNVTDFAGRSLRFSYDVNGNLISATLPAVTGTPNGNDFSSGKTTVYSYANGFGDARFNHNLLTITVPNEVAGGGPPRFAAQYNLTPASPDADRLVSLRIGGTNGTGIGAGGTIYFAYTNFAPVSSNDFATPVFQNTVTNRNGNVTQYQFNQLGNIVRAVQFTRGVRAGDPPGFTNTFAYNQDGELLARINAELDSAQYTFDTGNPDRLQQGNLLQVQRLPGPRGGDQPQIVTSMTYETNFNFVATSTDARGNVATNRYDARGNCTNITHRIPSIREDFEYNSFGQATARVLPDNGSGSRRRDVMTYYNSGPQAGYLQQSTVDAVNFTLTTTYEYDAVGNLVRVIDPRTNDTLYTYNALNQVMRQSSRPIFGGVRYTNLYWYDANNNLVRADMQNRDAAGVLQTNVAFTTIHEYDILDQRTREVREKGSAPLTDNVVTYGGIAIGLRPEFITEEYRYDADGNRNLTRFGEATAGGDPFDVVSSIYDERDMLFRAARAAGNFNQSTTQTDYDLNGNQKRTLQGLESAPRTTSYTYDGYDRLICTLDAMGNTRTNYYDADGNLVSERTDGEIPDAPGSAGNLRLAETLYAYDAMDRLISRADQFFDPQTQTNIDDGQAETLYVYSPNSQILSVTDDRTNQTAYTYDTMNRLVTVADAKSNTVSYLYDPNSNLRQKIELDLPDVPGQSNETFTTQYAYDSLDRRIRTLDNISNRLEYAYDSRGNPTISTNARGNRTLYMYDGLSRQIETDELLTSTGNGLGSVIGGVTNRQVWDDSGRLRSSTDGNSNTTQYVYDSLDRLVTTINADGTTNTSVYDVHGNRVSRQDENGTVVNTTFDLLNRVTTNTVAHAPGVLGTTNESYSYDGRSRIIEAANDYFLSSLQLDSLSHPRSELQVFSVGIVGYLNQTMKYDGLGNRTELGHPSGTLVQTFDSLNRLKTSRFDPPGPGATNAVYQYIGRTRVARIEYGNGTRTDVGYDGVGRVASIQHSASGVPFYQRSLGWDEANNLTQMFDPSFSVEAREFAIDSLNRLVHVDDFVGSGTATYHFDPAGNRTNVLGGAGSGTYIKDATTPDPADFQVNQYTTGPSNTSRAYDANGNLTSANGHTFSYDFRNRLVQIDGGYVNYRYDCYSRRFGKMSLEDTNLIIFAGMDEIEEFSIANSTAATYVRGNGMLLQTMATNGQRYFFHGDQLGSPVAITATDGTVVESRLYDEYGNGAAGPISSVLGNPYNFGGLRYDHDTGWYLCGNHFLDPAAGRFTTRTADPMANRFTYSGNNPLSASVFVNDPDDDSDEEPAHFECGEHYLWWLHHHRGHGRPTRSSVTVPIEIVSLGLQSGIPPAPGPGDTNKPSYRPLAAVLAPPKPPKPCPYRDLIRMYKTPWHKVSTTVKSAPSAPGHVPREVGFASVVWERDIYAVWATCTLMEGHPGPHNCVEETTLNQHISVSVGYSTGEPQGPPKDHWTDDYSLKDYLPVQEYKQ